jgi:hypothetical protein
MRPRIALPGDLTVPGQSCGHGSPPTGAAGFPPRVPFAGRVATFARPGSTTCGAVTTIRPPEGAGGRRSPTVGLVACERLITGGSLTWCRTAWRFRGGAGQGVKSCRSFRRGGRQGFAPVRAGRSPGAGVRTCGRPATGRRSPAVSRQGWPADRGGQRPAALNGGRRMVVTTPYAMNPTPGEVAARAGTGPRGGNPAAPAGGVPHRRKFPGTFRSPETEDRWGGSRRGRPSQQTGEQPADGKSTLKKSPTRPGPRRR